MKFSNFRIAQDEWHSQEYNLFKSGILSYDKVQHWLFALIGTLILIGFLIYTCSVQYVELVAMAITTFVALAWEIKDGFIPDTKDNYITIWKIHYCYGGDGFSVKDLLAGVAGINFAVIITTILKQLFS